MQQVFKACVPHESVYISLFIITPNTPSACYSLRPQPCVPASRWCTIEQNASHSQPYCAAQLSAACIHPGTARCRCTTLCSARALFSLAQMAPTRRTDTKSGHTSSLEILSNRRSSGEPTSCSILVSWSMSLHTVKGPQCMEVTVVVVVRGGGGRE